MKEKGSVKWYNEEKKYGFIIPEDTHEGDIFFHYSDILPSQKSPHPGALVQYIKTVGKKGLEAKEIEIIE